MSLGSFFGKVGKTLGKVVGTTVLNTVGTTVGLGDVGTSVFGGGNSTGGTTVAKPKVLAANAANYGLGAAGFTGGTSPATTSSAGVPSSSPMDNIMKYGKSIGELIDTTVNKANFHGTVSLDANSTKQSLKAAVPTWVWYIGGGLLALFVGKSLMSNNGGRR